MLIVVNNDGIPYIRFGNFFNVCTIITRASPYRIILKISQRNIFWTQYFVLYNVQTGGLGITYLF